MKSLVLIPPNKTVLSEKNIYGQWLHQKVDDELESNTNIKKDKCSKKG